MFPVPAQYRLEIAGCRYGMEFSHSLMWTAQDSKIFFQHRFCLAEGSLFRRRPETARAPRAAAVKHGRRPPPEAARSVLGRGEHDANLDRAGALSCRRRLPHPFRKRRSLSAKIRSVAPLCPACDATFAAGHHGCGQACQAPTCFGVLEARNRVRYLPVTHNLPASGRLRASCR